MQEEKAYYFNEGFEAREQGKPHQANPYMLGRGEATWWWMGWENCDEQIRNPQPPMISRKDVGL